MKLVSLIIAVLFNGTLEKIPYEKGVHFFQSDTVPVITPAELKDLRKSRTVYVLDTRSEKEYRVSRIAGSRFISYKKFSEDDVRDIPRDGTVVLYCSVGYRSGRIAEKLSSLGYRDLYNLYGGIFHWKNSGYTVVNDRGATEDVHGYSPFWSRWLRKGNPVF